jgi:gamma-glutamylcyclotransferase (GGCT)/AIG2-like uncharacterized protein YtfP
LFNCETESIDTPEVEQETDNTLIKKIVYNQGAADEYTEIYTYKDGNKLTSLDASDGNKSIYTYEGDKLVREDIYIDGVLSANNTLKYNTDGKVIELVEYWSESSGLPEQTFKISLSYNSNGTIQADVYRSDEGSDFELDHMNIISFNGTNISSIKDEDGSTEYIYTYDTKNNIHKNIYAIEVLSLIGHNTEFGAYILGNKNNITSDSEVYNNESTAYTYEYVYGDNDYPISATYKYVDNGVVDEESIETITYFYE